MSGQRPAVKYVLTDIEGTTSDIAFVHDVLFPYASERLPQYIREHHSQPEVRVQLDAVARESDVEFDDLEGLIGALLEWIRTDQKVTPLKALQGHVWRHGYREGHFKGHLYQDAYEELTQWSDDGLVLGVYSSGSVEAQKLLFGYSVFGDLTSLFSDHFDTKVGHKREANSYLRIADELISRGRVSSSAEILFLSDVVAELDAAKAASMLTCELRRDQASPATDHLSVMRFTELRHLFKLSTD